MIIFLTVVGLAGASTSIYYQDFEGYSDGDDFGVLTGLKNASNTVIGFSGGTVETVAGNNMLKLQGSFPNISAECGIMIDLNTMLLQSISFDFYFNYLTASQDALEIPTTFTAEVLRVGPGNKVSHTPFYLLNFNYTGKQTDLMDVSSSPNSYNDPYNTSYSKQNRSSYTADLSGLSQMIAESGDSIALVFSILYPDWNDNYDTDVFVDNIEVSAVPEPSVIAFFLFGGLLTMRIYHKVAAKW